MGKYKRYRFPSWLRTCICIIERALLPIIVFQTVRTILFPTSLDVFILGVLVGCLLVFHLEII